MKIHFKTNLDQCKPDVLNLNSMVVGTQEVNLYHTSTFVPRIGDSISFNFKKNNKTFTYSLQVYSVEVNYEEKCIFIDLHLPKWQTNLTLGEWMKWFKDFRGVSY